MKTIELHIYLFPELSEEAQERALDDQRFTNVDSFWWDNIYEDARQIGLKIKGFELENGYYCNGEFTENACFCAGKILDSHGESTETYQIALSFRTERDRIIADWPKDEHGELASTGDLDSELDRVEDDFLTAIRWAYHSLLIQEYNFLTGDKAITETFEAQDCHFTADGRIATRLEKLANVPAQNQEQP
ncbi:hypothetical protein [Mucilaginibacter dorajii]|uniref:Uncharacterized protein n=1 Tax=Mucilaginibacter dorajii TaxID=692994 RepID=A0ABP7QY48_9SPHI|nr:hypothetical protein [Mucilaginibacter dorajii]MCS3732343.1 hypothetical protein [Mucilaginibacter dorajii]